MVDTYIKSAGSIVMGKLIPEELRKTIPALYETEDITDPTIYVKLFLEGWTWFITEISIDNNICFGYVVSPLGCELGYFSLEEIETARSSLGLPAERDLLFNKTPLSEIKKSS